MPHRLPSIAIALLALAWAGPLNAQGSSFGIKGGLVSSELRFDDLGDGGEEFEDFLSKRTGFAGGVFVKFALGGGALGFQLEGLYVQKGMKGEAEGAEGELVLTYAELPVLLRFGFGAGTVRPYLLGGASAAYELSCKIKVTFDGLEFDEDCDSETVEGETGGGERRKVDLGAVLGGGLEFGLGRTTFLVEARYSRGLQSLDETGETDIFNDAILIMAGVTFPLGGSGAR